MRMYRYTDSIFIRGYHTWWLLSAVTMCLIVCLTRELMRDGTEIDSEPSSPNKGVTYPKLPPR